MNDMAPTETDGILSQLASVKLPEIELSLGRMRRLLQVLGNPQQQLPPVLHVAGTNGKGSTIAFLRAMYQAAGYQVHAYTSPHLVRFHERIVLSGEEVEDGLLKGALMRVQQAIKTVPVTYFEATTAAAFLCFAQQKADMLLLETGLGGEFDATNVLGEKLAAIIASIDYDHQDFLGNSLAEIAQAKAGIIPHAKACISLPQRPEVLACLQQMCAAHAVPLTLAKPVEKHVQLGLLGGHQRENAGLAVSTVAQLQASFPVQENAVKKGLALAHWPARLQQLRQGPMLRQQPQCAFFLDGGHNPHAASMLAQWVQGREGAVHLFLAMRQTKDVSSVVQLLAPHVASVTCLPVPGCADGMPPQELAKRCQAAGAALVRVEKTVESALNHLNCDEKATVLLAGSLYFAGEVLKTHA